MTKKAVIFLWGYTTAICYDFALSNVVDIYAPITFWNVATSAELILTVLVIVSVMIDTWGDK
jgi:hypothetical protein